LLVNLQNKKNMKLVYLSGKIRAHLEDEMNMLSEFSKNKIPIRDMSSCIKGYK
jgi:hypothetical protein